MLIPTHKDEHGRSRSVFKSMVEASNVIHRVKRENKIKTVGERSLGKVS